MVGLGGIVAETEVRICLRAKCVPCWERKATTATMRIEDLSDGSSDGKG